MTDPNDDHYPEYAVGYVEATGIEVRLLPPGDTVFRDQIVGAFMDSWSKLEHQMHSVFSVLLGVPDEVAFTVLAANNEANRFKELLLALGKLKLGPKRQLTLERLCNRMDGQSKWRNRIVHGKWRWHQRIDNIAATEPVITGKWVRVYESIDPEIREKASWGDDAKITDSYHFTVERIRTITAAVDSISADFSELYGDLCVNLFALDGVPPRLPARLPDE